jgi:stearoyl-CoA desaturase (Delta-9 desaturase)
METDNFGSTSLHKDPSIALSSYNKPRVRVTSDRLRKIYRRVSMVTVAVPVVGTLFAIALLYYAPIGLVEVGLLVGMYALTILGVEVGFHRHFSHRAFQAKTPVRVILAILGSMAAQGGVVFWVAHHRCHHQYTDLPNDPHSPLLKENTKGSLRGFWHAHIGWLLEGKIPNSMLFAKEILRDPVIAKVNQWQQIWVLLGLVIPTILGGILTHSWLGALQGFLWGGLVRIFIAQQVISSTNSICHLYGGRPFKTDDGSTNNLWLAIPSWGQSWHNNHHAFHNSAVVGFRWWQIDLGSWVIRLLEKMGLVWGVKVPTSSQIEAKKLV